MYFAKEITEKLYENIMNSIKLQNRKDTVFINCTYSRTSDAHRLILNLTGKKTLKWSNNYVALYVAYTIHRKI